MTCPSAAGRPAAPRLAALAATGFRPGRLFGGAWRRRVAESLLDVDRRRALAIVAGFGHDGAWIEDHDVAFGQTVFDFDLDVVAHSQTARCGAGAGRRQAPSNRCGRACSTTASTGTDSTLVSSATRISTTAVMPGRKPDDSPVIFTIVAYSLTVERKGFGSG